MGVFKMIVSQLQLRSRETLNTYRIIQPINHKKNSFSDLQQMVIMTGGKSNHAMKSFSFAKDPLII